MSSFFYLTKAILYVSSVASKLTKLMQKLVAIEVWLVNQSTSTSVQYGRNISDFIFVTRHSHCFSCG
ncbi:hypothetical protein VCR26J2_680070 [Vibrio coralliirubri]|nr:hypothetical protein VCR6J2_310073 [Vibrio coralliirubri]CDT51578.1 hypothetical protein VCR1J2_600071 [Vibrio coralliirubri]CDT92201.1 hypothetical protein VCR26J2_680070 [Vibrio coralliirubri]CDT92942.1 hypothetical protein VCR8J2_470070 [Vibrio coralliirubri]